MRQLVCYGLVGVSNTVVTLVTVFVLLDLFHVHYLAANAAGYALGIINSFTLNKIFTFKSTGSVKRRFALFLLVFAGSYLVSQTMLVVMVARFGVGERVATVIALVVYTGISYVLNRDIVFSQSCETPNRGEADE